MWDGLVSTTALFQNLQRNDIRVIDATYFVPTDQIRAQAQFSDAHIAGAQFWDIDGTADLHTKLPHMLPTAVDFAQAVSALGIGNHHQVVVYDSLGIFSAPRVWWMFKVFGHDAVAVLDGGLPKWQAEGYPILDESTSTMLTPENYGAQYRPEWVRSLDALQQLQQSDAKTLIDLRSHERFEGHAPEPRPGLRSGHIPGSQNLPWTTLLTSQNTMLPKSALRDRFQPLQCSPGNITFSCGSGVTACIGALAWYIITGTPTPVYDGSWAEWGSRLDLPIEF